MNRGGERSGGPALKAAAAVVVASIGMGAAPAAIARDTVAGDAGAALAQPRCTGAPARPDPDAPLYVTESVPANPFVPKEQAPDQWLAKLFTEGLGCAPSQDSYAAYDRFVQEAGCSADTLRSIAVAFLTSSRFRSLRYGPEERLLVLWRIAREAEPDRARYYQLLADIRAGQRTWREVVRSFFDDSAFASAVPRLCSGEPYGMDPSRPVIDIPTSHSGAFAGGSGDELQARLDHAAPGEVVRLERRAVVRIDGQVRIPPGVTLATAGDPSPRRYASMARLVRTRTSGRSLVALSEGAKLEHVWVDGQRSNEAVGMDRDSIDVEVLGGARTAVRSNRITNTSGWSNLVVLNAAEGTPPCADVSIEGNLIDGYSSKFHWYETTGIVDGRVDLGTIQGQVQNFQRGQRDVSSTFGFADGISNQCWDSRIADNELVDITDVSIVLFGAARSDRAADAPHQQSVVEDNTIVNAGNSGWAAMTVDQLYKIGDARYVNFDGTTLRRNLVWTSPNAFLLLIAGVGTKPWFGDNTADGYGTVRFEDNTSGSVRVNTQMAIAVSRMAGAVVDRNTFLADLAQADLCPVGVYIGVDESAGSRVQEPNEEVTFPSFPIPSQSAGCLSMHF